MERSLGRPTAGGRREGAEHRFEIEHGRGGVGLVLLAGDGACRAVSEPTGVPFPAVETGVVADADVSRSGAGRIGANGKGTRSWMSSVSQSRLHSPSGYCASWRS